MTARVRPGAVRINNEEFDGKGHVGVIMTDSHRRVGAEGERVRLATVYFDVKAEAAEVPQVAASFEAWAGFTNWLAIRVKPPVGTPTELPVTTEVEPVDLTGGLLKIQTRATRPGDVNLDYALDLSDALGILDTLFSGKDEILCAPAADFNADRAVNISDAVAIVAHLFQGAQGPEYREVFCDEGAE